MPGTSVLCLFKNHNKTITKQKQKTNKKPQTTQEPPQNKQKNTHKNIPPKNPNNKTPKQTNQNKNNPTYQTLKWRKEEFLCQETNFLPINITTSQVAETHLWPVAMTPSMCIFKLCKNPKPQVTPWVSVFVISSTLSSGSLKGHYKAGKCTNDVMLTSHTAYCIAQHSIWTDSICFLFRDYYHCSTPKMQNCFMQTSLNEDPIFVDKMQKRYGGKKIIIFKCLKNRSEK